MVATRVKLDLENLGYSTIFEKITRTHVRDSFPYDDVIYFVVNPGFVGKALGKGAVNIKKLQDRLNKRVRVIEYSSSAKTFIERVMYPLKVEEIVVDETQIILKDTNTKTKGKLIGRDGCNLRILNEIVGRFFQKKVRVE
tara:strand:+ start:187 stop:606 length:420 start_codon:yes stop_codon:yes gene_type:complete